jgi:4-amino-4-deoxy-L-arabinose transferase-like glycosyltransferase
MTIPEKPEPSVLDYIKGRLFPGRNPEVEIPETEILNFVRNTTEESPVVKKVKPEKKQQQTSRVFWQFLLALIMLIVGQKLLEPPTPSVPIALFFWGCALALLIWHWFHGRFETDLYPYEDNETGEQTFRLFFLWLSLLIGIAALVMFSKNRFTGTNTSLWLASIISLLICITPGIKWKQVMQTFSSLYKRTLETGFHIQLTPWLLFTLLSLILVFFFRFFRLDQVPLEMISDHAEKLLDINDVLSGTFPIFFVRNTGREGFQMYLCAAVELLFGTGISFITLKIGTAIMGLFTAVYMYFLGKETGNRWVGLFAFILCGIGYWPNVISRIGLRFTLYAAFTAPALYYFFKGMRRKRWSDLILSGISIGIGLGGYSPYRVVPVLIILGVVLYLLHHWNSQKQRFAIIGLAVVGIGAFILFLPTLRYILDQPGIFAYRALTRTGSLERPLPGPAWQIFLNNLWLAVIMPFWKNGSIWAHSIPYRPALDVVTGGLYLLGIVVSILRYVQHKDWRIPFILLSIPFLMLPSVFSLAFPGENPSLNRTAGALVPIFLVAAMGLDTILQNIKRQLSGLNGSLITAFICGLILITSMTQNYNLVFVEYNNNYAQNSLNTSQIGKVVRSFIDLYEDPNSVYVVGYPYWVDTRLVAMNAGFATRDFAIWPDHFIDTVANKRSKLFIINQKDTKSLDQLRQLYPDYYETLYIDVVPTNNFIVFLVPPTINSAEEVGTLVP